MVKGLGVTVKPGVMGVCWACTVAKAKQKNVVQFSMHQRSVVPGERVFVDISSIKTPKDVPAIPRANWRIVVDECTNFKVSHFFQRKDQMAEATCELLKQWRDKGSKTMFIRMDKAGENKLLEQRGKSKDWQFDWVVEYTPRDTPKHNHMADLGFAVLGNKG